MEALCDRFPVRTGTFAGSARAEHRTWLAPYRWRWVGPDYPEYQPDLAVETAECIYMFVTQSQGSTSTM
jgi:hypothetical protein